MASLAEKGISQQLALQLSDTLINDVNHGLAHRLNQRENGVIPGIISS